MGEKLRFLVVDDEPMICRGIRSMLGRLSHPAVGEIDVAYSGGEAIDAIGRDDPDVVVVDVRMPDLSGLTVIESAREAGSRAAFFVLSGHDEFGFVREAFKLGALDYLLKPANLDDLRDLVELARSRLHADFERSDSHGEARRLRLELQIERSLERDDSMSVASAFEAAGMEAPHKWYRTSIIRLDRSLGEKRLSARKIVAPIVERTNAFFFWTPESDLGVLWNLKQRHDADEVRSFAESATAELRHRIGPALCAIGPPATADDSMLDLYRQTAEVMLYRLQPGTGRILAFEEIKESFGVPAVPDTVRAEQAAAEGDFERLVDLTERLFADTPVTHGTAIATAYESIVYAALRYCEQTGVGARGVHSKIEEFDSMASVRAQFRQIAGNVDVARTATMAASGGQPMERAVRYIEAHLHEDIDMGHVAEAVQMSYSHFSRAFKQHMGEGFNRYVHQLRMRFARRLLHDPWRRIIDVSQAVGYRNPKRFARVFKEHVGVTPDQYRRGQLEGRSESDAE